MKQVIAFSRHPGFALLLASASGVVIFGLYPTVNGLVAAYTPRVMVANVPSVRETPKDVLQEQKSASGEVKDTSKTPEQM